jgi:lysophospholipase L1-like esterase
VLTNVSLVASRRGDAARPSALCRLWGVPSPRSLLAVAAAALAPLLAAGCDQAGEATSGVDLPAPALGVSDDPAAVSGAADGRADHAADIDTVVMIGDSLTVGATPALEERYELLDLEDTIEAQTGKRMAMSSQGNPSGARVTEFVAANGDGDHTDEVWVIALGTNDISQFSGPDDMAAAVNEVLDAVPDDAALVWVDTYIRGRADDAEALNAVIRDRVTRRGDSAVAPWTAFADGDGVLSGDGVHPTTDGADVFAYVVTDTVRAFLGR